MITVTIATTGGGMSSARPFVMFRRRRTVRLWLFPRLTWPASVYFCRISAS